MVPGYLLQNCGQNFLRSGAFPLASAKGSDCQCCRKDARASSVCCAGAFNGAALGVVSLRTAQRGEWGKGGAENGGMKTINLKC